MNQMIRNYNIESYNGQSFEEHGKYLHYGIKTNQNNVVLPTNLLIKKKNTDFRVLLAISLISNVDNNTLSGSNSRYCSIKKVDRNMKNICDTIGMSPSNFRKQLRVLLKHNTEEFKLVKKVNKDKVVHCYEINYKAGEFVIIDIKKAYSILKSGSSNSIKLYANLLWLCVKDGEYIERELTQDYLAELMGLSPKTPKAVRIATKCLIQLGLINTTKVWESDTLIKDGMPIGSKPVSKIFYSIVL